VGKKKQLFDLIDDRARRVRRIVRERRMQNEAIAIELAVATDGADCT
jgi:hypothetical protein